MENLSNNILSTLNVSNCLEVFERALLLKHYNIIRDIEKFIDNNAVTLKIESKFNAISSKHLSKIIERDTFNIPEIMIFTIVHNWHI